jgi:uncharacterized alpha-E superfamily protein
MFHGARSADVWVVSRERVSDFSLLPPSNAPLDLSRGGGDLPSRVADNLYWLGRYAERAEGIARLARVVGARVADLQSDADLERSGELAPLLTALRAQMDLQGSLEIPAEGASSLAACEASLVSAVCDPARAGSVAACVASTLRVGRVVRDRISLDTWRVLAALDEEVKSVAEVAPADAVGTLVNVLNRVVGTLASFSGLVMENMTRGQAWHFLDMGRRLERAATLVTLLRATIARPTDREGPLLEAVLDVADSGMTYRRRYLATLQVPPVVDLLLTDETNPRSVLYQARALGEDLRALPPYPAASVSVVPQKRLLALLRELELAEVDRWCAMDAEGARPQLDTALRTIAAFLPALSESLSNAYLSHATLSVHLHQDEAPRLSLSALGELP